MTKARIPIILILSVLTLGIAILIFFTRNQPSLQDFPALVHRDCAPWDGAAFTVEILMHDGTVINISIWQPADIRFRKTFTFPDDTGQVGNAYILPQLDSLEILSGRVTFQGVQAGMPVEGRFSLRSDRGRQFEGIFHAEWDDQMIMCG